MLLSLVCFEVNLTSVPQHTWWLDSAATTHSSVSMQGCLSCQNPSDDEDTSMLVMAIRWKLRQLGLLYYCEELDFIWI